MQVESTTAGRSRAREVSPRAFRKLAWTAVGALYLIVSTGAVVRLTASGLGCEHWPGCSAGNPFPEKDVHAYVEFGNRLVGLLPILLTLAAWLGARLTPTLPRSVVRLALVVFLGTLAQAPLGLLTIVLDLHPLLVVSHLLLALLVLGGGVVVALEAGGRAAGASLPLDLRRLGGLLAGSALALVVSGTLATAAGPHSGGPDIRRLGTLSTSVYVHAAVVAVFGGVLLFLLGYLAARRATAPGLFRLTLVLAGVVLVQMGIGELQYRTHLPWGLVLVHVALAAAIWALAVALSTMLWLRRPA